MNRKPIDKKGEKHHSCKLNNLKVRVMRHLKKINPLITYKNIGEIFGVSRVEASKTIRGKSWSHIPLVT